MADAVSLPTKLKNDAIVEAVFELRFTCGLPSELVIGRLAALSVVQGFDAQRLPTADIPELLRQQDANLRYQPSLQLTQTMPSRMARLGGSLISYHVLAPYPGWTVFSGVIRTLVRDVFGALPALL